MRVLGILALTALLPSTVAAAAAPGPVAVMPFRNVSADASLAWMTVGIAETLVSDIKSRGSVTVVERDQIDRALREIAFQADAGGDVGAAAQVGRIVGAKTVVVGGFQRAGAKLRITARFVTVETGVVLGAAKADGKVEQIFELQDRIVAELLGEKSAKPRKRSKRRPRPKPRKETVRAYELFAKSLQTVTERQRVQMLREALKIDPTFFYAQDELSALEARLRTYEERASKLRSQREQQLRAVFADVEADPMKRQAAATEIYSGLVQKTRHAAIVRLADEVYATPWPDGMPMAMPEMALMWMFSAYQALGQADRALQVGEQFLQKFPVSSFHPTISNGMRTIIDRRRQKDEKRSQIEVELAKLEEEGARIELDRCEAYEKAEQWAEVARICGAIVSAHAGSDDDRLRRTVQQARWLQLEALLESGDFATARAMAQALLAQDPEYAERRAIRKRMKSWPRD